MKKKLSEKPENFFNIVMKGGTLSHSPHLSLKSFHNTTSTNCHFTIVVSKKVVKSAVTRNKVKRRLRMLFQELKPKKNVLGIFFAKKGIDTVSFSELRKEAYLLIGKID